MTIDTESPSRVTGLKTKIIGLLFAVLMILLTADIVWTYQVQKSNTTSELLEESRVLVTEMDAVWDFISLNQDTINYTTDGVYEYKSLHCAIAGKAVAALFSRNSDYSIRFTNLNPRNEQNAPDAYERGALESFATSDGAVTEHYGFVDGEGESVFRYVSAMKVSEDCVECHGTPRGETDVTGYAKEGWDVGDLAGAVSVTVPTSVYFVNMNNSIINNVLFFFIIILSMALIIYLALSRLITQPLTSLRGSLKQMGGGSFSPLEKGDRLYATREIQDLFVQFNTMAASLSSLYASLEAQVLERTEQLSQANEELERQKHHVERVNSKLTEENRYKSDFLAIVSHELRTPLTSILAFTDLMTQNISPDDKLAHKQLDEIDINGQILLELVNNVLETARIQAGHEQVNLELVDLNDIIGMIKDANESLALKKDIRLTMRIDPRVPLILSDWEKVRRILLNLVSNAIKFTGDGGFVRISASYNDAASSVDIKVTDNGRGIPADKQDLIFERFTQENMSTVRRYGGSGLGLALARDLATMLGGVILVESEPGKGSTFTLRLPVFEGEDGVDLFDAD
jgi:signal transduction histidine kinase